METPRLVSVMEGTDLRWFQVMVVRLVDGVEERSCPRHFGTQAEENARSATTGSRLILGHHAGSCPWWCCMDGQVASKKHTRNLKISQRPRRWNARWACT